MYLTTCHLESTYHLAFLLILKLLIQNGLYSISFLCQYDFELDFSRGKNKAFNSYYHVWKVKSYVMLY